MRSIPIFKIAPRLQNSWISLIEQTTPVYRLSKFSQAFNHSQLYVKREDLTSDLYGGNKVRNLEFILGKALSLNAEGVVAIAPVGSNYIAALAAQSKKVNLPVQVYHFQPHLSEQMIKHAYYSLKMGADLKLYPGGYARSLMQASLQYAFNNITNKQNLFYSPVGGSNLDGALGHVNSFLEMLEQVNRGEIPSPDVLVVGVGTCGTMAGLLAAKYLMNHPVKIVGIRCVDKIYCNKSRIARLANQLLNNLGVSFKIKLKDIHLVSHGEVRYGESSLQTKDLADLMKSQEGIILDTTYTTKVISSLVELLKCSDFKSKNILYWHTFSDVAVRETHEQIEANLILLQDLRKFS